MSDHRCATCKHWNNQREDFRQLVKFSWSFADGDQEYDRREAIANEADRLYGECQAIGHGEVSIEDDLPAAMTKDGSDYWSALYTRAEFGCTLWTAQEPPT